MKVLVVEDDSSVRETLGMVLEAYQHDPILVTDGQQALDYLEDKWPDVMLLDLSLPDMSGEEVYQRALSRFGKIPPTVVLTAVQQGENRVRLLPGAFYLAKPYTLEQLAEMINQAAASRGAA